MANPKETGNNERLLLSTKISIPKMPSEFVSRPRLIERIDRGVKGPLTLVAAPAGFGKTNLLVEWAQKTEHPLAWLSIDPDDNDINRFFGYLVGALQTQEPHLGEDTLDIIHSSWGVGLDVGITILLNEIAALPKELVLVCDDFQELEDQGILQNINFILKHIPHNFHIVIASRVEPALDLPFLRAKGWLTELGLNDLRFSSDEVALFFRQAMQLNLTDETITALEKRTDGWVTALQMAAVSLRDQADPEKLVESLQGDAHYMVDFLAEEVLDRQPEEIRQFLLRSSILDSLNGSL
ncbi:MAG: hypothetical protein HPY76_01570 [Anaerolineae bacterium]|nr:hypothetical protein [Anaerolineae bacterium]